MVRGVGAGALMAMVRRDVAWRLAAVARERAELTFYISHRTDVALCPTNNWSERLACAQVDCVSTHTDKKNNNNNKVVGGRWAGGT